MRSLDGTYIQGGCFNKPHHNGGGSLARRFEKLEPSSQAGARDDAARDDTVDAHHTYTGR